MAEAAPSVAPGVGNPLANPAFVANPYPVYALLRTTNPMLRPPIPGYEGPGAAVLTRYADVEAVLRDPRFSVDRTRAHLFQAFSDRFPRQLLQGPDGFRTMLMMDPPDHTRLRHLVNRAFTPRRVEERLSPRIETLVDELLDAMSERSEIDVMRDFAEPLPAIVIAELLGVPTEDHRQFKQWSSELLAEGPGRAFQPGAQERTAALFGRLREYMRGIVAERRRAPGEDLISGLIEAQAERDALSEGELISTSLLLLIAGHETTTNLIGNGLLALLRNPDQLERLRREPGLLENAIEELLRYDSPVQATVRIATEDVELGGSVIPKDAATLVLLGAANRDPAVFPEPDRLDLARENLRHLSFGLGTHFCLGAGLARLEARAAFRGLLERFPRLSLATEAPEYRPNPLLRGLRSLPVRLALLSLLALGLVPASSVAQNGDATIHACVKLNSGNLRIVGANDTCSPSEALLSWSRGATLRCPADTTLFLGVCIENVQRAPLVQALAVRDCADEGRRLPSGGELQAFRELPGITLNGNGEWTDDVADITAGAFTYVVVSDVATGFDSAVFPNAYRCIAGPLVE